MSQDKPRQEDGLPPAPGPDAWSQAEAADWDPSDDDAKDPEPDVNQGGAS